VGDLDTQVLVVRVLAALVVHIADHGGGQGDTEDIVRIGEESNALSCEYCMHVACSQ
jgi:hypothetical protein